MGELLAHARREEKRRDKLETEKQLMPLWLVSFAISRFKGEEIMDFEEFIRQSLDDGNDEAPKAPARPKRSGEEIMAEFMPIVDADRLRGANG